MKKSLVIILNILFMALSFSATQAAESSQEDEKCRWNLAALYSSPADWEASQQKVLGRISELSKFKGRLYEGASLLAALELYYELLKEVRRLGSYASNLSNENLSNAANLERAGRAEIIAATLASAMSYFSPEVIALGDANLKRLLATTPGLRAYEFLLLDTVRLAPHTLSSEGEALLASAAPLRGAPYSAFEVMNSSDLQRASIQLKNGESVTLTPTRFTELHKL
jgi:oligoendopeptidase F